MTLCVFPVGEDYEGGVSVVTVPLHHSCCASRNPSSSCMRRLYARPRRPMAGRRPCCSPWPMGGTRRMQWRTCWSAAPA